MDNNSSRLNNTSRNNLSPKSTYNPIIIFIVLAIIVVLLYYIVNYIHNTIATSRPIQTKENILLDVETNGMAELEIGSEQLPTSSYSNEYSLSMWVYVDNFDYKHGERKFILRRGDIRSKVNPEIYLHPTQNTLQVNVSLATSDNNNTTTEATTTTTTTTTEAVTSEEPFTNNEFEERNVSSVSDDKFIHNIANHYDNSFYNDVINTNELEYKAEASTLKALKHSPELNIVLEQFNTDGEKCDCDNSNQESESAAERKAFEDKCGKCMVKHFPLQKWVHLVVSQYNNVIDVYVDGKLYSSCALEGFPDISMDNLVLSPDGGYSGKMSSVVYFNSALTQDDVYKIYVKGPDGARKGDVVNTLKNIPSWIYLTIFVFIVVVVGYSFLM